MSTIQTVKEYRQQKGSRFLFLINFSQMAVGAQEDIIICVGNKNAILEKINIEVNAEILSWQAFSNVSYSGGTLIDPIPRNLNVNVSSKISIIQNATIDILGTPFTVLPVNIIAQIYRNNKFYINQDIISSDFNISANVCYLFRIKNISDAIIQSEDIQFSISTSNE